MSRRPKVGPAVALVLALLLGPGGCQLLTPEPQVGHQAGPGSTQTITSWQIHDSQRLGDTGEKISQSGYTGPGWLNVPPRSTVLAGLVANGRYPDLYVSRNLSQVDPRQFQRPWWYRATFPIDRVDLHTVLHLEGVIPYGDAWLNGKQIATATELAGAHNGVEPDITGVIRPGQNVLAVKVYPADTARDLIMVWHDWSPPPTDSNMGIWQDVTVHQSGPVALTGARVTTALRLPGFGSADLTVKVEAHNASDAPVRASVAGRIDNIAWSSPVTLNPGETRTLTFDPSTTPSLRIANPKVWWPNPLGAHPVYQITLSASASDTISDLASTSFGIRDVKSTLDASGNRQFTINGSPLLIRGGGWAPDLLMRTDVPRLTRQLQLVADLGLNTIRMEGMLETNEFYDLADRMGIMLLPGWTCCSKWQSDGVPSSLGTPWTDADRRVAEASMSTVARRIRNHPSVIAFLLGSDMAPPADLETPYLRALKAADWPDPIISSASASKADQLGSSGMKMVGPYQWVPPNYWYGEQYGAAYGFASELSAGPNVPRLDSLTKMLTPAEIEQLWRSPDANQYHAGPTRFQSGDLTAIFSKLDYYDKALFARYGQPASTADYLRTTQVANYEAIRAQFEAYAARMDRAVNPSTGVIHWMMDNGWPSLIWHLYDWYLAPDAGTYATKKANEPLHVLWQYDTGQVTLVNQQLTDTAGLTVSASVYTLDGKERFSRTVSGLSVGSMHTTRALTVPAPAGFDGAYFVKLTLRDAGGKEIDRNVYWWSTAGDQLEWANSPWWMTPTTSYADMSGLMDLPRVSVAAASTSELRDGVTTVTVTLTNTDKNPVPAFFVEATLRGGDHQLIEPVNWSDNAVTLWPGEKITLRGTARTTDAKLTVDVAGVNVAAATVPAR